MPENRLESFRFPENSFKYNTTVDWQPYWHKRAGLIRRPTNFSSMEGSLYLPYILLHWKGTLEGILSFYRGIQKGTTFFQTWGQMVGGFPPLPVVSHLRFWKCYVTVAPLVLCAVTIVVRFLFFLRITKQYKKNKKNKKQVCFSIQFIVFS